MRGDIYSKFLVAILFIVAQNRSMLASPVPPPMSPTRSPLDAFTGSITRTQTGPLYSGALAVVALAMVLLPVLYTGLIVLTGWMVFLHLKNDTWLLQGAAGRGALLRFIFYLGPAVVGGILVFFMIKPFFAKRGKAPDPLTLDPAKEALMFAFVRKICGHVNAPQPSRIDVDCQVNASASLRKGIWSRDLVLTVGLPLAAGLDMRQFAGVLAHEFGHFAQGAGMRLTYVIRNINFWFARVVYERDEWDLKLERLAKQSDWRIGIVLHAARGCVWFTRRILWGFMHAGNAISCFMLRQMEYDADSYEAKVAGSDTFERTAARLQILNAATQTAYEDVRQNWVSKRLPENLPLLIGHKAGSLPADVQQKISASISNQSTGWFDTHPCDGDRTRAARSLKEAGVFHLTEPATRLFSDFDSLSKLVTRHQYEKHLGLEFSEQNLMPAEEILRESAASAEADALVSKYYGGVNLTLKPLLTTGEIDDSADEDNVDLWREARQRTETFRAEAEKLSAECYAQQRRLPDLNAARFLARAGFRLEPKEFGLPADCNSAGEQASVAQSALEQASADITQRLNQLEPFASALRLRVMIALRLGREGVNRLEDADRIADYARLLAAVGAEMPHAHRIAVKEKAFAMLAQNCGNHSDPSQVESVIKELMAELEDFVRGVQQRLRNFTYPFPHARGQLTVAEYARYEKPSDNDWARAYLDADAHVDRLFALNYRLIGRILVFAEAVEKRLDAESGMKEGS